MTTQPDLHLDPAALNDLLERCRAEGRHPTDEEVSELLDVQSMMALGHQIGSRRSDASAWYRLVFAPMGFTSDEQEANVRKLYEGEISIEEYVTTLSDREADIFCDVFPILQRRYTRLRG